MLDGVVRVDRDGEQLAEYGPGACWASAPISRAAPHLHSRRGDGLPGAAVPASQFGADALTELATGHRREEAVQGG